MLWYFTVVMYGCEHWTIKKAVELMLLNIIVVLEKTVESPLDWKEIKPVNPKGNQSWIFIGRTDAEAPMHWPPDSKGQFIGKDPDAGKDWRQDEKGTTEGEMVGWHHQLYGHEFEASLGIWWGTGKPSVAVVHGIAKSQTQLSNWTTKSRLYWVGLTPHLTWQLINVIFDVDYWLFWIK